MHEGIQLEITDSEVIVQIPNRVRVAFTKTQPSTSGYVTGDDLQRMFDLFAMAERLITPRGANPAPPPFPNGAPSDDRIPSGTRRRTQ